jgi:predicted ATPase
LAEAYGKAGQVEEGLHVVAEALVSADTTAERLYEAELHRIEGELLIQQAPTDTSRAERCFQRALAIARRRQAKSSELRAAVSLSRLWQRQGKFPAAHKMLAEVYSGFTEGLNTVDLQEAKALLDTTTGEREAWGDLSQ